MKRVLQRSARTKKIDNVLMLVFLRKLHGRLAGLCARILRSIQFEQLLDRLQIPVVGRIV